MKRRTRSSRPTVPLLGRSVLTPAATQTVPNLLFGVNAVDIVPDRNNLNYAAAASTFFRT